MSKKVKVYNGLVAVGLAGCVKQPLSWLVNCFEFNGPLSISDSLPMSGRKDEITNVQTIIPAPTASTVGPCPTIIQISRTPEH